MEYNKIIAVTGLPGLYELLSSKSDGAIVRSLDDKTTRFVSSRIHNFSHLESIEVYTVRDNVNLVDILKAMETGTEKLPDEKDADALKNYFTKVYPDLDFSRVYSSDLKKMVKWFSVLKANNIEIKLTEAEEGEGAETEGETDDETEVRAEEAEEKAAPKKATKKKEQEEEPAEAPKAKKAAAKKVEEKEVAATGKKAAEEKGKAAAKSEKKPEKKETTKKAASTESDKPKKAAKKK
ncbi:MAG TPA: DUF5606 domain-containing protein [Puia sp.]|jgi:pyruvate/2-oxoglutarate dehydrogenase complex dihydrolipoamide acyltransferase (E2) component|nr:DUF5606 domain-containing protein [Puia sp.]